MTFKKMNAHRSNAAATRKNQPTNPYCLPIYELKSKGHDSSKRTLRIHQIVTRNGTTTRSNETYELECATRRSVGGFDTLIDLIALHCIALTVENDGDGETADVHRRNRRWTKHGTVRCAQTSPRAASRRWTTTRGTTTRGTGTRLEGVSHE